MRGNKAILLLILLFLLTSLFSVTAYNFTSPIQVKQSINGRGPTVFINQSTGYVSWGYTTNSYSSGTPPINSFVTKFNVYDWSEIATETQAHFAYNGLQFGASGQCGGVGGYTWSGADAVSCTRSSGGQLDDGRDVFWCQYNSHYTNSPFPERNAYIMYAVLYNRATGTYTQITPAGYPTFTNYFTCSDPGKLEGTTGYGARRRTESILAFVDNGGTIRRIVGYSNATYSGSVDAYPSITNLLALYKWEALNYHTSYLQCFGGNQNYECGQGLAYVGNINEDRKSVV